MPLYTNYSTRVKRATHIQALHAYHQYGGVQKKKKKTFVKWDFVVKEREYIRSNGTLRRM